MCNCNYLHPNDVTVLQGLLAIAQFASHSTMHDKEKLKYMHGKSLKITCLYSEVLFHLWVIASAADCALVHQYITWYCLPAAGFRPHMQCYTVAMTSTISVFRHIATAELYNSVLAMQPCAAILKQGQATSWFWCK